MSTLKFSSTVPERALSQWQQEYDSALRETDHRTLFERIEVAEAAILTRRDVLTQSPDGFAERQEIQIALAKLCDLKKDVLNFL